MSGFEMRIKSETLITPLPPFWFDVAKITSANTCCSTEQSATPNQSRPSLRSDPCFGSGKAGCSRGDRPAAMLSPPTLYYFNLICAIHYGRIQYLTERNSYFMPTRSSHGCGGLLPLLAEVVRSERGVEILPSPAVAPGSRWNELC